MRAESLRTAVRESQERRGRRGWLRFFTTARVPELPVSLAENSAALVGLGMALVAVAGAAVTGDPTWDAADLDGDVIDVAAAIAEAERRVRQRVPAARWIYVDPSPGDAPRG